MSDVCMIMLIVTCRHWGRGGGGSVCHYWQMCQTHTSGVCHHVPCMKKYENKLSQILHMHLVKPTCIRRAILAEFTMPGVDSSILDIPQDKLACTAESCAECTCALCLCCSYCKSQFSCQTNT